MCYRSRGTKSAGGGDGRRETLAVRLLGGVEKQGAKYVCNRQMFVGDCHLTRGMDRNRKRIRYLGIYSIYPLEGTSFMLFPVA